MKVIFLDIDGVLNSDAYMKKQLDNSSEGIKSEIDPATLILLKKAVDTTGAKIILSSSWRIIRKYNELEKFLMKFGISLSGKTPYIDGKQGLTEKHIKQIVETFGKVNKRKKFDEER